MATTEIKGFGVELDPVDLDVDSASEQEHKQQEHDMACDLAWDAAVKHFKPVTFLKEAGFLTATKAETIDSLIHPTVLFEKLSKSNPGWRLEAGTLLVYDEKIHDLCSPWMLERCWLWHEEHEVLLDVTTPGWQSVLMSEGIRLPVDALDEVQQARGNASLTPHLGHLSVLMECTEHSLLYLPGVLVLEARNHLDVSPDDRKRQRMWSGLFGGDWYRLTKMTQKRGCCAALAREVLRG